VLRSEVITDVYPHYPIKSVAEIDGQNIMVGTSSLVVVIRTKDMQITDTIWKVGRSTRIAYYDNEYYIGTPNGLYVVKKDKSFSFLGDSTNALSKKITDIKSGGDGTLWVATGDAGIVGYKDKK